MKPFRVIRYNGKLLLIQRVNVYTWEVMPDKDDFLTETVLVIYFPGFDKFTRRP